MMSGKNPKNNKLNMKNVASEHKGKLNGKTWNSTSAAKSKRQGRFKVVLPPEKKKPFFCISKLC